MSLDPLMPYRSRVWWCTLVILVRRTWRQEFKANLCYKSLRPVWAV